MVGEGGAVGANFSAMSDTTLKSFAALHHDYAFFEEHVNETEATLEAWLPLVQGRWTAPAVLDFGAGSGSFSSTFLKAAELGEGMELTLIEPDPGFREQALRTLQPYRPQAWPLLDRDLPPTFDLIFSHHVLYYVTELRETLGRLYGALKPGGRLLAVQGGRGNGMNSIVFAAFDFLRRKSPYRYSEDTAPLLEEMGIPHQVTLVSSLLDFPDSEEGRLAILRFLLSEHLSEIPRETALAWFEPFAVDGRIQIPSADELFFVEKSV